MLALSTTVDGIKTQLAAERDKRLDAELDARIEVAKVASRDARQSHPDMCHYDGMEEAIETLKKDFLAWREQE